jgi:RAB6A-GEF complex partner protein 2
LSWIELTSFLGQGDVLGHDLMQPYVLLRDEARVQKVSTGLRPLQKDKSISGPTWTTAPEFLSYVDELLEKHETQNLRTPMPSVTTPLERRHSSTGHPSSCKDSIDLAILRSNQATSSNRSTNRFDIARNGRRIAEVVLNRPSHRLGETILATIDFTAATLPCFSLRATLETSEKVDPSLALRSNTSIHRATRRIYASFFENTLFSTRVVFSPAIPVSATPTLLTTGINLDWDLRFEFVTTHSKHDADAHTSGSRLLELISQDERGSVFSALENLPSESFEIAIPLTVYGETVREPLAEENEGYSI